MIEDSDIDDGVIPWTREVLNYKVVDGDDLDSV